MNKNTSVETTNKGQATKVPTGKIKTKKSKEEIRKAREQEYENFRVNALKRRAKRMGMSDEQTNECVEKLKKQLKEPKQYNINVIFKKGMEEMAIQAIKNAKIDCKILTKSWACVVGDQNILAKLREILPASATIHPYAKKFESVLPKSEPVKVTKPSNNSKTAAAAGKVNGRRKRVNVAAMSKKQRKEFKLQVKALKASWKASKKSTSKVVSMKKTKRSTGSKKASRSSKRQHRK